MTSRSHFSIYILLLGEGVPSAEPWTPLGPRGSGEVDVIRALSTGDSHKLCHVQTAIKIRFGSHNLLGLGLSAIEGDEEMDHDLDLSLP